MNSYILMASIIQEPELRFTPDGLERAEFMVQFPGMRAEDPPGMLKVVAWGSLAKDAHENYHMGDSAVLEGRLGMNVIQRREGFKEKQAELILSRIYRLGVSNSLDNYNPSYTPPAQTPPAPSYPQVEEPTYNQTPYSTPTPVASGVGTRLEQSFSQPSPQPAYNDQNDPGEEDIPF